MTIASWKQWTDQVFKTGPDGTLENLLLDLRPEMTGKFRRIHGRVFQGVVRQDSEWAYTVRESRRCVQVTARKYRARKGRKR